MESVVLSIELAYNDLIISTYRRSEYTTIVLIPVYKDYIIYFIFL